MRSRIRLALSETVQGTKEESHGFWNIKEHNRVECQDLLRKSHYHRSQQLQSKSGEPSLCF